MLPNSGKPTNPKMSSMDTPLGQSSGNCRNSNMLQISVILYASLASISHLFS